LGDVHHQDKTTDIYAVGIMLFQFITGTMPFEGTMAELIKKQLNEKIPLKMIPYKAVRNIVAKATAKKQADRYQSATEMRVDVEHLSKADAVPSATSAGEIVASIADVKKGKGKLIGIVAAAVVVIGVGLGIALSGDSDKPVPKEQTAVAAVAAAPEARDAGKLTIEAIEKMSSPATVNEGVNLLTEIATKYGDKKEAADGIALLAALTQPSDIENTTEQIKSLREATANDIFRDVEKAHAYAEQAVKTNPQSYKALYELATDYLGGEARMKKDPDYQKAQQLFTDGLKYAQTSGDKEYIELFTGRLELLKGLLEE